MIKVYSTGYNNNVKLYNITIIVHYSVSQVSIMPVGFVLFKVKDQYLMQHCWKMQFIIYSFFSINYEYCQA